MSGTGYDAESTTDLMLRAICSDAWPLNCIAPRAAREDAPRRPKVPPKSHEKATTPQGTPQTPRKRGATEVGPLPTGVYRHAARCHSRFQSGAHADHLRSILRRGFGLAASRDLGVCGEVVSMTGSSLAGPKFHQLASRPTLGEWFGFRWSSVTLVVRREAGFGGADPIRRRGPDARRPVSAPRETASRPRTEPETWNMCVVQSRALNADVRVKIPLSRPRTGHG